jgi:hypothetical protein
MKQRPFSMIASRSTSMWLKRLPIEPGLKRLGWTAVVIAAILACLLLLGLAWQVSVAAALETAVVLFLLGLVGCLVLIGLLRIVELAYQFCPKCLTQMHAGARRCPACHFEPAQEESER